MSGYRMHLVVYALAAFAATYLLARLGYFLDFRVLGVSMLVGLCYTLLPDIDVPSSRMREVVSKVLLAAALLCMLAFIFWGRGIVMAYAALGIVVFLYLLWFTKHRGIFHTVYAGLVLSLPLWLLSPFYCLYAFVGFSSHLLSDGKFF